MRHIFTKERGKHKWNVLHICVFQQRNKQKKEFVYENIKKIADVWNNIDKKQKNMILKSIISKIVIVNGDIEIQLKNF